MWSMAFGHSAGIATGPASKNREEGSNRLNVLRSGTEKFADLPALKPEYHRGVFFGLEPFCC